MKQYILTFLFFLLLSFFSNLKAQYHIANKDNAANESIITKGLSEDLNSINTSDNANLLVKQSNQSKTQIYPNPSKGSIYVLNAKNYNIVIYNILGKKVLEINNCETEKIDLYNLPNGNYIVQIIQGNVVSSHKLSLTK